MNAQQVINKAIQITKQIDQLLKERFSSYPQLRAQLLNAWDLLNQMFMTVFGVTYEAWKQTAGKVILNGERMTNAFLANIENRIDQVLTRVEDYLQI